MSKNREDQTSTRKNDQKLLGDKLREARDYVGFSQDQVAKSLGIPRSALSLIESGQRGVDVLELKKLADLYERPVSFFTEERAKESIFDSTVNHLARKAKALTPEDQEELARFAEFLLSRKQKKGR